MDQGKAGLVGRRADLGLDAAVEQGVRRRVEVPRRPVLVVAGALAVVLVVLVAVVSVTGPGPWPAGQPAIVDGGFFLNAQGALTPISAAEYRADLKAEVAAFLCFGSLLGVAALARLGAA
ncbi:hypothetical protein ACFY36_03935 [Actinoplanes sp. NPDC000266]